MNKDRCETCDKGYSLYKGTCKTTKTKYYHRYFNKCKESNLFSALIKVYSNFK